MMAFVHDHHRAKPVDDLQQGGGVGILHRMGGSAQSLRQLCQTAVLLPCLELLFFASEGIVGQHQNGKLLGNCRDVEPCGRQKLVFGVDLHPAVERHINFLAVGVRRVPQGQQGSGRGWHPRAPTRPPHAAVSRPVHGRSAQWRWRQGRSCRRQWALSGRHLPCPAKDPDTGA